jgi:hypothetical protein
MSKWLAYDEGRSIGKVSTEGGVILLDEEHQQGARITLKRGSGYISISCHIYGWTDHTRFLQSTSEAQRDYAAMKAALGGVVGIIESAGSKDIKVWEAISEFVRRFP